MQRRYDLGLVCKEMAGGGAPPAMKFPLGILDRGFSSVGW